jgi:serine/threonine protein kinase/tetratricopeptide (TPR) repeat protein
LDDGSDIDFEGDLPPPPRRPVAEDDVPDLPVTFSAAGASRRRPFEDAPAIAGYEILGELGRGGMGAVYHARQSSLGREVALKIIVAGAHASWSERSRFRVEAETAARLQHPHIVPIYEIGEQGKLPYLALEYVEGGSLARALAVRPMVPNRAAGMVETLARAMEYVHEHGVVHRDLKPANVLLTAEGLPKITDFGLAKWLDAPSGHQTQSGTVLGTPSYMPPEQAKGQTALIGPATDVYALGAILYEMLTGRPPFHAATSQETVQQLLTQEPLPPSRLQPQVPRDLETVCLKCLRKEPGRRYPGAGALAHDLRCFLDKRPIRARPTPFWERIAKWTRRRPAIAGLWAVSSAAVLALAVTGITYNARLRRERAVASLERDAARKAQERSEADFRLALDAVKRFYTEVSENRLLTVPTMDPVRIELLQRAREFYEVLARERPGDPDVQAELARAGWRLAAMVAESRSAPEGVGLLAQPIAIQERLARQYADRPEYRSDLARSYNNLGIMHRSNNERDQAARDWERALAIRQQLVRDHPDEFLYRRDLAQSLHNFGNLYRQEGQPDRADEAYRRALAIQERLANEAPEFARRRTDLPVMPFALDPARIRYDLAFTHFNLATLQRELGRSAEAAEGFRQALELLTRLVAEQPQRTSYRGLLANTHFQLGHLEQATGRLAQAAASWNRSRTLLEKLVVEQPENPLHRHFLAQSLHSMSILDDAEGRAAEAETNRLTARAIEERLNGERPESSVYFYEAALLYLNPPAPVIANGASPVDQKTFSDRCAGFAVAMLAEAEKAGYFRSAEGIKDLKTDRTLDPLRQRQDFRELLARVLAAERTRGQ